MPFGNALSLFALYIVSVCGAFLFVPFALFYFIPGCACIFHPSLCCMFYYMPNIFHIFRITCIYVWSLGHTPTHTHSHQHTHNVILRFRLKAFLSTRSLSVFLSVSVSISLPPWLYYVFVLLSALLSLSFSTGIINGQRDRPPSCLGKWSKNKWMIERKPRQLAKGENSSKKWPTAKGQVIVFKTNVGRANFRLQL